MSSPRSGALHGPSNKPMGLRTSLRLIAGLALAAVLGACGTPAVRPQSGQATPVAAPTRAPGATPPATRPGLAVPSRILAGHTDRVTLLAWSPDGTRLASAASSASDLTIRIWDAQGALLATLQGHTAPILSLAWSPDGDTLASGSADQTVRFWKQDGTALRTLHANRGKVWAVAWSPDGTLIASGSIVEWRNPTVQVWKPDGSPVWRRGTLYSGGKFFNLLWSPDGTGLLGGATDYKLWTRAGQEIASVPGCEHCTPRWGAAWSPDGQTFALGDENGTLQLYDRAGKPHRGSQSDFDVNSIAWSPDGEWIAAGRDLWSSSGQHVAGVNGRVSSVAWSADGQYLAVAADTLITLVRPDGTQVAVLREHTDLVNVVSWSPAGLVLASASDDHTVRLWYVPAHP